MTEVTDIPSLAEADDYDPAKEGELFDMLREAPAVLTQDELYSLEKAIDADREGVVSEAGSYRTDQTRQAPTRRDRQRCGTCR
jgi:hypothetical protein